MWNFSKIFESLQNLFIWTLVWRKRKTNRSRLWQLEKWKKAKFHYFHSAKCAYTFKGWMHTLASMRRFCLGYYRMRTSEALLCNRLVWCITSSSGLKTVLLFAVWVILLINFPIYKSLFTKNTSLGVSHDFKNKLKPLTMAFLRISEPESGH